MVNLEPGGRIIVGTKQTRLAIEKGEAAKVFVARDAESRLVQPVVELCRQKQIPIEQAASMRELGRACGIQVGAAMAAVLKG